MPLHWGSAPRWLFARMVRLSRSIVEIIAADYGQQELLRRLSDPVWFQSLGCVLGFDWHSSGVTTTVCGAIKEAVKGDERAFGFYACGGKGAASRKTPLQIEVQADRFGLDGDELVRASRMSAKVDSAGLQDGFQVYQHVFFGTTTGEWAVVQQGMNTETGRARRYHWLSEDTPSFVADPHKAIACDRKTEPLNMVASEAGRFRDAVTLLAGDKPEHTIAELKSIRRLSMAEHHPVLRSDISDRYFSKVLLSTYEQSPAGFDDLLLTPGVGPKTIRTLALIADVVHGARPSFRDPVTYSFAVGGKDGYPYPVDRAEYDRAIAILERGIRESKLGRGEKLDAFRRLEKYYNRTKAKVGSRGVR